MGFYQIISIFFSYVLFLPRIAFTIYTDPETPQKKLRTSEDWGGFFMKSNSIRILLEVGQFLNRKEKDLQTVFTSEQKFLYDEMNLIRNVILLDLGVVKLDGKQCEIINDDIYDAFSNVYWAVCETEADDRGRFGNCNSVT